MHNSKKLMPINRLISRMQGAFNDFQVTSIFIILRCTRGKRKKEKQKKKQKKKTKKKKQTSSSSYQLINNIDE